MSDYKIITIGEYKITEFINIEHGKDKICLTIHKIKNVEDILLTPVQAKEIAKELIRRTEMIENEEA